MLYCRFCHTVQRQHAHNEGMSDELSRALEQINNTSKEANKLKDQLGRETNTLDERKYVSEVIIPSGSCKYPVHSYMIYTINCNNHLEQQYDIISIYVH